MPKETETNKLKQVEAAHYQFAEYVDKGRWCSFYYQINEITSIPLPNSILEVGVGTGILGTMLKMMGYSYTSMDIDPELQPDCTGSVLEMPFSNKQYDSAVCFQVLEHLPYIHFEKALNELFRVTKKTVVLSLPHSGPVIACHIPKICRRKLIKYPFIRREHIFDGEHHWEIDKKGYEINSIKRAMDRTARSNSFILEKDYRVWENPYHHFFVFRSIAIPPPPPPPRDIIVIWVIYNHRKPHGGAR